MLCRALLLFYVLLSPLQGFSRKINRSVQTENAKETTLSVSFTDGKGKFFTTAPWLQLLDTGSGKVIKEFYRTVDSAGNPDPKSIPPGVYDIRTGARNTYLMRHIEVEANKKNMVTVKVKEPTGALCFRYEGASDRPVTEFDALVAIRFVSGPEPVKQKCSEEQKYPPGNYYVEVNTAPVSRFNVDLDWGMLTEIQIPESGYAHFRSDKASGLISLYTQLGEKMVKFMSLSSDGTDAKRKTRLMPGYYEARWKDKRGKEQVTSFRIQSNKVAEVYL